jgi:hypothetical protein
VLFNGTFMQANCCTNQAALLEAKTLTWTPTGTGKFDPNDEEGWTLLPNGKVLTVDAYVPIPPFPYLPAGKNFELYDPKTGGWSSAGSTRVQWWDSAAKCGGEDVATFEFGPGVLRLCENFRALKRRRGSRNIRMRRTHIGKPRRLVDCAGGRCCHCATDINQSRNASTSRRGRWGRCGMTMKYELSSANSRSMAVTRRPVAR